MRRQRGFDAPIFTSVHEHIKAQSDSHLASSLKESRRATVAWNSHLHLDVEPGRDISKAVAKGFIIRAPVRREF